VNTNSSVRDARRLPMPTLPPDRVGDLLSSFSDLRSSNRALMDMLRGSIHELRELRSNLRKQQRVLGLPAGGVRPSQNGVTERYGLTRREAQVARLLAQGRSNQAIARELNISAHTARHHTQRILSKLEVHSRGEAGAKIRG
jgi:DNA-binding NarL/FixJ family response regulator